MYSAGLAFQPENASASAPTISVTTAVDRLTAVSSVDVITYTIRFRCASITDDCIGAVLSDQLPLLPPGVALLSKTGTGGLVASSSITNPPGSGPKVSWAMQDPLPAGSTGIVKIVLGGGCLETSQGNLVVGPNAAAFAASNAAPPSVTSSATASVSFTPNSPDGGCVLATTSTPGKYGPKVLGPGGAGSYQLVIPGGTFVDTFPAGMDLASFSANGGKVDIAFSCNGASTWSRSFRFYAGDPGDSPPAGPTASATNNAIVFPGAVAPNVATIAGEGGCSSTIKPGASTQQVLSGTQPVKLRIVVWGLFVSISYAVRLNDTYNGPTSVTNCVETLPTSTTHYCATTKVESLAHPAVNKDLVGTPDQSFETGPWTAVAGSTDTRDPRLIQGASDLVYQLRVTNSQTAAEDLVQPVITDLLPPELDFVPPSAGGTNDYRVNVTVADWFNMPIYAPGNNYPTIPDNIDPAVEPGCRAPVFSATPNFSGTGRTLLRWEFRNCTLPHGFNVSTPTIYIAVSARLKPSLPLGKWVDNVDYLTTLGNPSRAFSPYFCDLADVTNLATAAAHGYTYVDGAVDSLDVDRDGDRTERMCAGNYRGFQMPELVTVDSSKWVHGSQDPSSTYSRFPNVGLTNSIAQAGSPVGSADYKLYLDNLGNVRTRAIDLVDIMPYVTPGGDTMVSNTSVKRGATAAGSEWGAQLSGNITLDLLPENLGVQGDTSSQNWFVSTPLVLGTDYRVYYSTSTNPCRMDSIGQIHILGETDPATAPAAPYPASAALRPTGCLASPWIVDPSVDGSEGYRSFAVRLIRELKQPTVGAFHGDIVRVSVVSKGWGPEVPSNPNGRISWNSFAYTSWTSPPGLDGTYGTADDVAGPDLIVGTADDTMPNELLSSEPFQVGAKMVSPTAASLGDYVWVDRDRNGSQGSTEPALHGERRDRPSIPAP